MPRYIVHLTETERQPLEEMLSKGRHSAATATRAQTAAPSDCCGMAAATVGMAVSMTATKLSQPLKNFA